MLTIQELLTLGYFTFINCIPLFWLVGVNLSVYLLYHLLLTKFTPKYRTLSYQDKLYSIKNISKATFLCALTFYSYFPISQLIRTNTWDNKQLTFIGHIYTSTDLTGLLFVPGLSSTTKIHHLCVLLLDIVNIFVDFNEPGIHHALFSLTLFSVYTYLVNAELGIRKLEIKNMYFVGTCMAIYGFCILCNCLSQLLYVFYISPFSILNIMYLGLYGMIFYDDLMLMGFLIRKFKYLRNKKIRIKTMAKINTLEIDTDEDTDEDDNLTENLDKDLDKDMMSMEDEDMKSMEDNSELNITEELNTIENIINKIDKELDDKELDNKELDNTELDNTELDNKELDNTELDNTELDTDYLDNKELTKIKVN